MGIIKRLFQKWQDQQKGDSQEDAPKPKTPEELIADQVEGLKFMMRNQRRNGYDKGGKDQDQGRG